MGAPIIVIAAVIALAAAYVAVPVAIEAYRRYRGTKLVTCPKTNEPTHITVKAGDAALCAALGRPRLTVATCTHWPERRYCGQACLNDIDATDAHTRAA